MGRRRKKANAEIEQGCATLVGLAFLALFLTGAWRPLLVLLAGLSVLALAVLLIIFLIKHWPRQRQPPADLPVPLSMRPSSFLSSPKPRVAANGNLASPPPLSPPPPDDIEVTCPQCKAVLVAPATMAGKKVKCEGCRHVFDIPKQPQPPIPLVRFPDMTSFYFPPKPKGFTSELLRDLEWKRFENLVEGYFAARGMKTRPNHIGADGGVDIHLLRPDTGDVRAVVQCKSWHVYDVGVKPVRELYGVMAADGIPEGVFVTTGEYTNEARSWAAGKPLTLIDGRDLLKRLAELPPDKQSTLHAAVTAGDYTTPTCPQCGCKMVRRQNRKNPFGGSDFWGCPSFPRCCQTFPIKKEG